ncbi:MAG: phosphonate C-P lyase system protein PhnH [Beijerinckiaceae bacterium]
MLAAGFLDPVRHSQACFRRVMDAMARPGRIVSVDVDLAPPEGLHVAAAGALLTLCDFETVLHVSPTTTNLAAVGEFLRFHTDTILTDDPASAHFALVDLVLEPLALDRFAMGDPAYPDRSTTIVAQVATLSGGDRWTARGPGIKDTEQFQAPLGQDFAAAWARNNKRYPLGVDLLLVCGREILALPRSIKITMEAS